MHRFIWTLPSPPLSLSLFLCLTLLIMKVPRATLCVNYSAIVHEVAFLFSFFHSYKAKQKFQLKSCTCKNREKKIEANLVFLFFWINARTQIGDLISLRRIVSHREENSIVIDAICNLERADPLEVAAPFFFTWFPLFHLFITRAHNLRHGNGLSLDVKGLYARISYFILPFPMCVASSPRWEGPSCFVNSRVDLFQVYRFVSGLPEKRWKSWKRETTARVLYFDFRTSTRFDKFGRSADIFCKLQTAESCCDRMSLENRDPSFFRDNCRSRRIFSTRSIN